MDPYKDYTPPDNSGAFLKPEDGKVYGLRIMGEPVVFENEFKGRVSTRYAWPVWNYDDNKAQILQMPVTGFKSLAEFARDDAWGDPTQYDIKYKRTGTGTDTRHAILPNPRSIGVAMPEEAIEESGKLDLLKIIKGSILVSDAAKGKAVPKAQPNQEPEPDTVHDVDDEPVNLDDIPF
jgi:hypothetical protein